MSAGRSESRGTQAADVVAVHGGSGAERLGRRELLRRIRVEIASHGLSPEHEAQAVQLAEALVNGPTVSRRRLMQATAAGWAALAVAAVHRPVRAANGLTAVASQWLPASLTTPALAAGNPSLTASVFRREDMLALRLEFYNLVRSGSSLVRLVAGDPAYIVATFGYGGDTTPQNIAEQAFRAGDAPADNDPLAAPGDVDARLAGPTRLAFLVPATLTVVPYQLSAILALLPQSKLNVAPAALPPGATPSSAPALADPGPLETRIEAPWNLVLSPHAGATWSHATAPVTRNGRTELWHTRLSENDAVGRAVRAIWAGGYDASNAPDPTVVDDPFLMSLSPNDRWQIVGLSAGFGIPGYAPTPIDVDRMMLTALGAWLDSNGVWETLPSDTRYDLVQWQHIATMGRDQYVKVVKVGILLPFGHRAVRVAITERKVNPVESGALAGKPAAYLRRREFILVRQPVVSYPEHGDKEPNDGRKRPFRQVELKTLVTPNLGPNGVLVAGAYFPRSGGVEVPFDIVATDREGRASEFTMPLVFVTRDAAQNTAQDVVNAYNGLVGDQLPLRRRPFSGAKIGVTPSEKPGDTAVEVKELTFGAVKAAGMVDADRELPFYPTWTSAAVRLDAVEQVRGTAVGSGVEIEPHPDFITGGFGPANPAEVFAKLSTAAPLTFSDGGGDRSGGVITPDMQIVNLSRSLGPQGGSSSNLPTQFKPEDYFDGAKILGAIKLEDILEIVDFDSSAKVPSFKSRPIFENDDTTRPPKAIETTFNFKPALKQDKLGLFTPKSNGSMTLDVKYVAPVFPPGEPTWEIVGDLRNFAVTMVGTDLRFIRLHFSRLTFTARNGRKPDVTPYIDNVELDGPLKFVDSIKDYLKTPGTGPNIDVTPTQITAGFTLQIPNIPAGAVTIINIAFSASLIIPFNGDPARARFAMSSREHPFLVTYLALGGGGFFAIELGLDGVKYFELDIVAGVEAAIDLILVTAEVHYLFGCHIGIDAKNGVDQISYIRMGGHCGVWGVWSVTLDMYLALDYDPVPNELVGQARFTIEIEYLFLSKSVDLFVERRIAGPSGASGIPEEATTAANLALGGGDGYKLASYARPTTTTTTAAATTSPALGYATLVSQNEWNAYAAAFASDT